MGVDHFSVFAYGFVLREFKKGDEVDYQDVYNFVERVNKDKIKIGIATDAYYPSETFIYISPNDNEGFKTGNRGDNSLGFTNNLSISFSVNQPQIEVLNRVKEEFKDYISEELGWRAFYYAR